MDSVLCEMRVRLPRLSRDIERALSTAGIDLLGAPALTDEPVDVRLEVGARDESDARTRVRAALPDEWVHLYPADFIVSGPLSGVEGGEEGAAGP
jgi:hypothetical protein